VLDEVQSRLERIDIDGVLESGYIQELTEDAPFSPFPKHMIIVRSPWWAMVNRPLNSFAKKKTKTQENSSNL